MEKELETNEQLDGSTDIQAPIDDANSTGNSHAANDVATSAGRRNPADQVDQADQADDGFNENEPGIEDDADAALEAEDGSQACFEGDKGDLPPAARRACTELLRKYFISEASEGSLFQAVLDHFDDIERCMNNLYLRVKVSRRYRVAYAVSVPEDELVSGVQRFSVKRNAPLKRDETILLVRLRVMQHKLEAEDPDNWFVERRDMEEHLMATCYRDDLDEERVALRISSAIKTLCTYGYIKLVNDEEQRYRIMPILPAVLDLETAAALAAQVKGKMAEISSSDGALEQPPTDSQTALGETTDAESETE